MSNYLVLETLTRACSQNESELKIAEKQLEEWETNPGFYPTLLQVVNDRNVDSGVRWMATVIFKKGVDKYWRKTAPNAISEQEKKEMRGSLINTLAEPVNQVAIQIAVIISKTARFDFPNEWPELIPSLIDIIQHGENPGTQNRALLALRHVIQTLSSKRLAHDRRIFHELTTQLYSFMLNFNNSAFETFLAQVQNNDPQCQAMLENYILSLKIMRDLTLYGFNQPKDSAEAVQFVSSVFERVKPMLIIRKSLDDTCSMKELLEKVVMNLVNVLMGYLENFPLSFVPFIHPTLSLMVTLLFTPECEDLLFEKLIMRGLKLIQNIIMCIEYKFAKPPVDEGPLVTPSEAVQAYRIRAEFFQDEVAVNICLKLVTHYMKLQPDELELWDTDPEEFICCNGSEGLLRSCVESLFCALFRVHRDALAPVLVQLVHANYNPVLPYDLDAVLKKDAVYWAVGLAAFDLYDEIDMDSWFEMLQQEVNIQEGHYRIIRRRAVWLLGQWTGVRFSQHLRPALYRLYIPLLQRSEDIVVKVATAEALQQTVDDFSFNVEEFMEFVETLVGRLFDLLKDCKEPDTMQRVIWVLSLLIERVGPAIQPYSTALFHYIPVMWDMSSKTHMMRSSILNIVYAFAGVIVMDDLSPFFYTIVDFSLDIEEETHIYLYEDAIEVLKLIVENSNTINTALFGLLKRVFQIMENYTESFQSCCTILEAYIVLAPNAVLGEFGDELFACLNDQVNDLKLEAVGYIYGVVEKAMIVDPVTTINKATALISHAYLSIYCGSNMVHADVALVSRVVLYSLEKFGQIMEGVAQSKGVDVESFLDQILGTWPKRMVTHIKDKKKLSALAIASLLTVNSPSITNRISLLLDKLCEAFYDIVDSNDTSLVDTVLIEINNIQESSYDTANDRRMREISKNDVLYNVHFGQFLKSQVEELGKRLEPNAIERIMATLQPHTAEALREIQTAEFFPAIK